MYIKSTNMKRVLFLMSTAAVLLLASCNSNDENKSAGTALPVSDMKIILLQHKVINFDNWKAVYRDRDSIRREYGISHYLAGHGLEDTSNVVVIDVVADIPKAKEYYALPEKKQAWENAGVVGEVSTDWVSIVRYDTTASEVHDRVLIKHKVKDFDAWLKVFDNEGMEKRKSYGISERGLGRGVDDPNTVYIFFSVSDWKKANDRMNSEELKNTMKDAGVEGAPVIVKYTRSL